MRLANKNAIVTGSSRGIGRAIALGLAKEGANVAVVYRSCQDEALAVVHEVETLGQQAVAVQADVTVMADIKRLVTEATAALGSIDILVNNAGNGTRMPFVDTTEAQFDFNINVNLKGPFFLTQAVAKHMIDNQVNGSIINVSSISAFRAEFNISAYECAKAGMSMLSKSAALALAKSNIRVNTVSPGLTATDLTQPKDDPYAKPLAERAEPIPLARVGQPQDHVGAVVFLASDEASWVTGADIVVDGGETVS